VTGEHREHGDDASSQASSDSSSDGGRTVDEQFMALMEGLRTSLPGVQVLFAFLLTAPLQNRFSELDNTQRAAFSVAFYAAGLASILLIAPSIHQRLRAPITGLPRSSKRHLIWATWVAIVGSIVMGVAVLATVFLVSSLVFNSLPAMVATIGVTAVLVWSWLYLPLVTFRRH
jgi:hypothetical protein